MPEEINGTRFVSLSELADHLDIARQTLWRWRQNGRVPQGAKFRDGRVLFNEEQVRAIQQYANQLKPLPNNDTNQGWLFE